jgi:L-arabonate dehydrase
MTSHSLRSRNWFGRSDLDGFVHRSWLKAEGFSDVVFDGRPVIGIANSWSELTNCNAHLRQAAEAVKRGVWSAGGFPLEFPTISLGEVLMKPTTMMFRNLMSMDVEECIRAYPLDAVVLLSGCDKTTPAMLMGAASADVPAVMVTGGPMLSGKWRDQELGSGTDGWRLWAEKRAGQISDEEFCEAESCMSRSAGHCIEGQIAAQRGRGPPADDPTREHVDEERHVHEPAPRGHVRQIGDPQLVRPHGRELPRHQIRRWPRPWFPPT